MPWLAGVLAALAFALAFQGSRPIWDPDEGRYVDVALEMLHLDDPWTPHLHPDVPHFAKPPLTYWLIAGTLGGLGRSEWAARLPNAVAFAATILLVAAIARRLFPGREITAAVVYATSLLPFVAATIVTTDTVLAACVALGALGFVELRWGSGPPGRARLWLAVGWGLAFLTKGPPGLLSPAGLLLGARLAGAHPTHPARRLVSASSLGLFAFLAFGWYGYSAWTHPGLLDYLLGHELVGRSLTDEFDRNAGWAGVLRAYGPVLVAGMLPWWPLALARRRALARGSTVDSVTAAFRRSLVVWMALPLVVFALSQSRLPLYLLPLSVPAALLLADRLGPLPSHRTGRTLLLGWISLLLVGKASAAVWTSSRDGRHRAAELAAFVPPAPCEIVFIQDKPKYSLAFYLGCDIERVDLRPFEPANDESPWSPTTEGIVEELATPDDGRRYLVRPRYDEEFATLVAMIGRHVKRLGRLSDYAIYSDAP